MISIIVSIYLFIGVMLLSFMFVYSYMNGKSISSKVFGILSLTLQIYLLGYLMEINCGFLEQMLFWNQIQYFGIPFFPALWLVVSMLYTGKDKYLCLGGRIIIFFIPCLTFFMRLTNEWHHLYYSRIELQSFENTELMLLTKGPWYVVQMIYVLIALVLSSLFYFQRYRASSGDKKMQFRLLLLAAVLPYISLVLVTLNMGGIGIDYTALVMPPCILLINLALTRYNFLEIKMLARERVFEDSASGLILLNQFYRVVDFNQASVSFFQWFHVQVREEQLDVLLKEQPDIFESIMRLENKVFCFVIQGKKCYVDIDIKEFCDKEETIGLLVKFDDVTEREQLKLRLMELANTDELSHLNNRRRFNECAQEVYERAQRYRESLCVLMLDIDCFKKINDAYGHQAGDVVISEFSKMLMTVFRGTDILGRMGGEEFNVAMLNTDARVAYKKAEEFRKAVEQKQFEFDAQKVMVTVSIGVAELNEQTTGMEELINQADQAMYAAKHAGRNRTMIFESQTELCSD